MCAGRGGLNSGLGFQDLGVGFEIDGSGCKLKQNRLEVCSLWSVV